jgi:hypothetical protein
MPIDPLMAFAALSAQLADPFADRAEVLGRAGFDEERWKTLEDGWARRFREPGGQALAERLGVLFAQAVRDLGATRPAAAFDPPPRVNPLGDTLEAGARLPVPALPFTKPPRSP